MTKTKIAIGAGALLFALALPALAKTYKYTYPVSCGTVWDGVKATLANADNYAKVQSEDAKMTAEYQPKHSVHADVSGVLLQRMNHVTLVPKGTGCEMRVVSNYSGWGHDDQGDFKKRVDASLVAQKPAESASNPQAETPAR